MRRVRTGGMRRMRRARLKKHNNHLRYGFRKAVN